MDKKLFVTKEQLEVIFGRSRRTINHWLQKNPVRKEGDDLYYLPDVVQMYEKMLSKDNLQARLLEAKLTKLEYEIEMMQKNYIERAKVEAEWRDMVKELKQALLVLEAKISERCAKVKTTAAARKIIRDEVLLMLENLYVSGKYEPQADKKRLEVEAKLFEQFWSKLKTLKLSGKKTPKVEIK